MEAPLPSAAQAVLDYWFGAPGGDAYGRQHAWWFVKRPATDAHIRAHFLADIERALAGALETWDARPRGTLARIVLLDQFTRNAFRDTPRAFAGDAAALAAARRLVDAGDHLCLAPVERAFVYFPFEHAEELACQDRAVALFEALARGHEGFDSMLDYARRHREVIARFGRFPHRNAILGRASSEAERAFLAEPGSGF